VRNQSSGLTYQFPGLRRKPEKSGDPVSIQVSVPDHPTLTSPIAISDRIPIVSGEETDESVLSISSDSTATEGVLPVVGNHVGLSGIMDSCSSGVQMMRGGGGEG
jgi:hypothetical protein